MPFEHMKLNQTDCLIEYWKKAIKEHGNYIVVEPETKDEPTVVKAKLTASNVICYIPTENDTYIKCEFTATAILQLADKIKIIQATETTMELD